MAKATTRTTKVDPDRSHISNAAGRAAPAAADVERITTDGTALSAEERARMLRNEFQQEALPSPPKIPGFHVCWLSTNNQYDPIHKRIRVGYVPVKAAEIVGLEQYRVSAGEWEGFISCNEMVLFKIPDEVYQEIMMLFHHTMPMEEEARIKSSVENGPAGADKKTDLEIDEGFKDLAVRRQGKFL